MGDARAEPHCVCVLYYHYQVHAFEQYIAICMRAIDYYDYVECAPFDGYNFPDDE